MAGAAGGAGGVAGAAGAAGAEGGGTIVAPGPIIGAFGGGGGAALDADQFHLERQQRSAGDARPRLVAVCQLGRNPQLPLGAGLHQLQASCQPLMTPLTGNVAGWLRE